MRRIVREIKLVDLLCYFTHYPVLRQDRAVASQEIMSFKLQIQCSVGQCSASVLYELSMAMNVRLSTLCPSTLEEKVLSMHILYAVTCRGTCVYSEHAVFDLVGCRCYFLFSILCILSALSKYA